MIHNEHLRRADETVEIRHDDNGNAIIVYIKDGHAYLFRSINDMVKYVYFGLNTEREYVPEKLLEQLYATNIYEYDKLVAYYRSSIEKQKGVLSDMQEAGFNVVTCPSCGNVNLHSKKLSEEISCTSCGFKGDNTEFSDFYS